MHVLLMAVGFIVFAGEGKKIKCSFMNKLINESENAKPEHINNFDRKGWHFIEKLEVLINPSKRPCTCTT